MSTFDGIEMTYQMNEINKMMQLQLEEVNNVRSRIQDFINNDELDSIAYMNQKNYFNTVYINLYNGIELFANEFMEANKRLLHLFFQVAHDSNAYINIDTLTQELSTLNTQLYYYMTLVDDLPYSQYLINLNSALMNNIRNVIERMNAFLFKSNNIYYNTITYLNTIRRGIDAIQKDCWDETSQMYHYFDLDVSWVDDLNVSIAKKDLKKEGFSDNELEYLRYIGVDLTHFSAIYTYTKENGTKEELRLLKQLGCGTYKEAFTIDNTKISDETMAYLSNFLLSIYKHGYESDNLYNYNKILNALLLSKDTNYMDSNQYNYLMRISAHSEKLLQDYSQSIYASDFSAKERNEIAIEASRVKEVYNLYLSLSYIMSESAAIYGHNTEYEDPRMGLRGLKINKLKYMGNGTFQFDFNCLVDASLNDHTLTTGYTQVAKTSIVATNTEKINNEYQKFLDDLKKEKEKLLTSLVFDSLSVIAAIYCPLAIPYIALTSEVITSSLDGVASNTISVGGTLYNISSDDQMKMKKIYTMAKSFYECICNDFEKQVSKKQKELFVDVFGNNEFECIKNDKSTIVGEGFYDMETLALLGDWSKSGIEVFEDEDTANKIKAIWNIETKIPVNLKTTKDYTKGIDKNVRKNCIHVITGDFILGESITIPEFFEAIETIDRTYNVYLSDDSKNHSTSLIEGFKSKVEQLDEEGFK